MGLAIGLLLGAILLFWLGTRQRKKVYAEYEDDSHNYDTDQTDEIRNPAMGRQG